MKYLVMECRPAYAVVLGEDGAFLKVANMHYEVGQTLDHVIPLELPEVSAQPAPTPAKRWTAAFAAIAACLVLLVSSVLFGGQLPYASVYLTINPEVRIDVNRKDAVVGIEGINQDGATLLEGYSHKKKDLDTVMDELVDRAIQMDYLHEGGKITLSLDGDDAWVGSHGDHLNAHLNEYLTGRLTVTIDIDLKQPEPTAPTDKIVIPVGPDSYGDSDYGDSAYDPDSDYGNNGDSDYASSDYGDDDGQTDYGDTPAQDSDYVQDASSDYDEEDDTSDYETEDAVSDYREEDASSDYETEDTASDYQQEAAEDDDSDYEEETEEDTSDYQEADSDYAQDEEDGTSEYED